MKFEGINEALYDEVYDQLLDRYEHKEMVMGGCPEGQFFCNKDQICKPIPDDSRVMNNGIMLPKEYKEKA